MLADTASQNDHASLARRSGQFIELTDVADNIENQARRFERVEIYHVSDGSVSQRGTEHGNIVLDTLVNPCLIVLANHANLICPVVDRFLVVYLFTKSANE